MSATKRPAEEPYLSDSMEKEITSANKCESRNDKSCILLTQEDLHQRFMVDVCLHYNNKAFI